MKILKTGVGSDGGGIFTVDTIEYDKKLWLVPEWLDVPAQGVSKPRRIIRMDLLRFQKMTNTAYHLDYILNDYMPKAVLDGRAPAELAARYEIVELPEGIETPM